MNNPFDVLIYLDENLVRNLASSVLTGYIETTTLTQAFDTTLKAGMQTTDKIESSNQGSITKSEREGFKDKNKLSANNTFEHHGIERDIDGIQCIKAEKQVKTTYTTFVLNNNLMNHFNEHDNLHKKNETDVENDDIETGDLIEIEGIITNECFISYLDTLINLITIFGPETLDSLLKENPCKMNFTMYLKMITYVKSTLTCNNTQDLIMRTGKGKVILTLNKDNFMNSQCNAFDKINCHCKVVGKVIKTCTEASDSISLLRKTGQEEFFENFFDTTKCLLECLKENGILVPRCPKLRINEAAIQVMPLNIYV